MKYVLLALLCMTAGAMVFAAMLVFFPESLAAGQSFVGTFLLSLFILAKLNGSLKPRHFIACAAISLGTSVLVPLFYMFVLFWGANYSGPSIIGVPAPLALPILVPGLGSAFVWFCFYFGADGEANKQQED